MRNLFKWFFRKCHFCGTKHGRFRNYKDDLAETIYVCEKCAVYAERRAYIRY